MSIKIQLQRRSIRIGNFTNKITATLCPVRNPHLRSSIGIFSITSRVDVLFAHFERQNQVDDSAPPVATKSPIESPTTDPAISSNPYTETELLKIEAKKLNKTTRSHGKLYFTELGLKQSNEKYRYKRKTQPNSFQEQMKV